MYLKFLLTFVVVNFIDRNVDGRKEVIPKENNTDYELGDHTMVTDSNVFPYVVAILKKTAYISAGALIDESWVLTAADSLFLVREFSRLLRVRLGSINYKKGGILLPIKFFEIHPYFDDSKPEFDIALIKLPQPVRFTPSLNPIRLQYRRKEVFATHFIVTAWPSPISPMSNERPQLKSMELIKRRRMLTVSHLHPTNPEICSHQLDSIGINNTDGLMCLDVTTGNDPCARDVGAPVVLNSILWGIISSYAPEECEMEVTSTFVSLVAAQDIRTWIHATVRGRKWNSEKRAPVYEDH